MFVDDEAHFFRPSRFAPSSRTGSRDRMDVLGAEFAIEPGDIDSDTFCVAPAGEIVERDRTRGFERAQAGVKAFSPRVNIAKIVSHPRDAFRVGDRAVTGNDRLDIEGEDHVAGRDPVLDRSGPDDRMSFDKEDVAGERWLVGRHVGQRIAARMRGTDLDELDDLVADLACFVSGEGLVGRTERRLLEIEVAETVQENSPVRPICGAAFMSRARPWAFRASSLRPRRRWRRSGSLRHSRCRSSDRRCDVC